MSDEDYKKKVEEWEAAQRELENRNRKPEEVNYRRLRVRMPWGCWLWVVFFLAIGYCILKRAQ